MQLIQLNTAARKWKSRDFPAVAVILVLCLVSGCHNSIEDRKAIARHTQELRDIVKRDPNSEEGKEAFVELVNILNGKWSFARVHACGAFVDLGALATAAVPDLLRAATCGDGFVEQEAVHALASIGDGSAPTVDLLISIVKTAEMSISTVGLKEYYAAEGLGNIGEPARKAIPVLERVLQSKDDALVRAAAQSLDKLNPTGYYERYLGAENAGEGE
jgi:HEAT repeat protein